MFNKIFFIILNEFLEHLRKYNEILKIILKVFLRKIRKNIWKFLISSQKISNKVYFENVLRKF